MKHLRIFSTFAILVSGCAQPRSNTKPAASADARPGAIRVGMDFEKAHAILMEHGAKEFMLQVQLEVDPERPDRELNYYQPPSGPCMEIISAPAGTGRIVESISVPTYKPKSWKCKTDPEYLKFHYSFKSVQEYDLDNPPELSNELTSRPAAP